jgi:cis-L-3-hydroxyproline dehydratase
MRNSSSTTVSAQRILVPGEARGEVAASEQMLSFWGGVDPSTGIVIDRRHPLHGVSLAGKVVVLPKGKGSSTGSYVMLDALVEGAGPAGIVMNKVDEIISLGAMVYDEFYSRTIPVLVLNDDDFSRALTATFAEILAEGQVVLHG